MIASLAVSGLWGYRIEVHTAWMEESRLLEFKTQAQRNEMMIFDFEL